MHDEHAPGRTTHDPAMPTTDRTLASDGGAPDTSPAQPREARAAANVPVGWRVVAGLAAVASLPAILWTWFLGVITFTGCFIKCDLASADPLGGMLLLTVAGALLVAGAVCTKLAATGRTAGTARVATVSAVVASALVLFSIAP